MSQANSLNLLDVLDELLQLPPQQRRPRIDQLGLSDQDRTTLDTWLSHHENSSGFLERPPRLAREGMRLLLGAGDVASDDPVLGEALPPHVQGYVVLDMLGHGGMATVWRATQQSTGRDVALKVMSPLLFAARRARNRFDRELRLTASLHHPHIAAVYDGGVSGSVCFYAMELVEGMPLDKFVRSHKLSRRQILELMHQVCQAVTHAHQNGVIHRDLKPSNILVDESIQPRVLDFGLAKAVAEVGAEMGSDLTVSIEGDLAGTPAYMSPEQAAGSAAIDTRSDVYSLGVILFRLIVGQPPHNLDGTRLDVLARISHVDVPRPRSIRKDIDHELEAILLKALAREPQQRYATAADLAEDLRRYLAGEALIARPPTLGYLMRRRLQKHWVGASIAAAVAAVILATIVISYFKIAHERRIAIENAKRADSERDTAVSEKKRADEQAQIAKAVVDFFNSDVLGQASANGQAAPGTVPKLDLKVRDALDRAADKIHDRFAKQPLVEARIRDAVGKAYIELGEFREAEQHIQEAVKLTQASRQADVETFWSISSLGFVYFNQGRYAEAERLTKQALDGDRALGGDDGLHTIDDINQLGLIYLKQGQLKESEKCFLEASERARRALGEEHEMTIAATSNLADIYREEYEYDKAEPLYYRVLELSRKVRGELHPDTLITLNNLGGLYLAKGDYAKAESTLQEVLDDTRKSLGPDHPETARSLHSLALTCIKEGDFKRAKPMLIESLELLHKTLGDRHQSTLSTMGDLAYVYEQESDFDHAEPLYQQALAGLRSALGEDHALTLASMRNLAGMYYRKRDDARGEPLFLRTIEVSAQKWGPHDEWVAETRRRLAMLYAAQDQLDKAEPLLAEIYAWPKCQKTMSPKNRAWFLGEYGVCLQKLPPRAGTPAAEAVLRDGWQAMQSSGMDDSKLTSDVAAALAQICESTGRTDEAATWRARIPPTPPTPTTAATTQATG
jgi:serine/threonine protein kinase/Flp pilus assembly protein TadD